MMKFLKWLGGLVTNPATGHISHTKLWANVAGAVMTVKFAQTMDAPECCGGLMARWSAATP